MSDSGVDPITDAMVVLGVGPDADLDTLRAEFRTRIRSAHPDAGGDAAEAARLTAAHDLLRRTLELDGSLPDPRIIDVAPPAVPPGPVDAVEVTADEDGLFLAAPPHETFQLLLDAASTLGGIGHVDRHLGLLEVIVRFEGGPSCSVLLTLQGRAFGTEVFLTMESIEAAPTPPIRPVVEALTEALASPRTT